MCCWGKLQTSLSSIPSLCTTTLLLSSSQEDFRSPYSPGTLLLPSQFRSSQYPEARGDDPPLTSSSGNRDQNNRAGGDTSQVNIPAAAPTPGGAEHGEFTPSSLDCPQTPLTWGGGRGTGTIGKKTMPDPVLQDRAGGAPRLPSLQVGGGGAREPRRAPEGAARGAPRAPPPGSRCPPSGHPRTLVDCHAARVPIAVDQRVLGPAPLVRTYAAASYHLLHTPMSSLRGWGGGPAGGGRRLGGEGGSGGPRASSPPPPPPPPPLLFFASSFLLLGVLLLLARSVWPPPPPCSRPHAPTGLPPPQQ